MTDITVGQMFGAWEVLSACGYGNKYHCVCKSCGVVEKNIRASDLRNGKTLMCKNCSQSNLKSTKKDPRTNYEYNSWVSMIQRCTNPSCKDYKHYGARGITICDAWLNSFEAFYMMVGPRPAPNYTLERIDYEKGYEPGNVKWIPRSEQPKNKRDNVRLTIDGETKLVSEWALDDRCKVDMFSLYKRIQRGWAAEEAVFAPPHSKKGQWKP